MRKYCMHIMFLLLLIPFAKANGQADSLRISLLTCTPGSDAYAHFGHSAIRVRNESAHLDVVFNYGMFNYRVENFIYRFVKGETDYELGAEYTQLFLMRYGMKGEGVTEQVLNLNAEDAAKLYNLIYTNYQPENRVYRYNFLYDNCTTRARDMIEKATSDSIVYMLDYRPMTFRQILTEFTACSPWLEFGIDLVLGAEVDRMTDWRQQTFIPSYYMRDVNSAYIMKSDGGKVPLVEETNVLLTETNKTEDAQGGLVAALTPSLVFTLLLVAALAVSLYDMKRKRTMWLFDAFLLCLQGLAGVVVAFLFFFSEHPAVGTNWLVVIFNPLPLVWLPLMIVRAAHRQQDGIYIANMAVQAAFVVAMPFLPQCFNVAVVPLALTLLLRSAVNVFVRPENKSMLRLLSVGK